MTKICQDCGASHDEMPISHNVLELYKKFAAAQTQDDREELAEDLAAAMFNEHDLTDPGFSDEVHDMFEAFERAIQELRQVSRRLARYGAHVCLEYAHRNGLDLSPKAPVEATKAN